MSHPNWCCDVPYRVLRVTVGRALMAGFMPVHPFAAVCMVSPLLTIGMAVRWDFAAAMVVVLDILLCALTLGKLVIRAEQYVPPPHSLDDACASSNRMHDSERDATTSALYGTSHH